MKLVLLGTGGYHPSDSRQTACLMIPEAGIVLDAGTAMYRVRDYLCTAELDIFLTHSHLDHVVGITYLFDVVRDKNVRRVTVHGAAPKLAAFREHLLAEPIFPAQPPCQYVSLTDQVALAHGGRLTHFHLEHPGGALGLRLDWPQHSMAYVTDTTAAVDAAYVEHIRGVDLLVHECQFRDEHADWARKTGHSATSAVAEVARAAQIGRLVLVHIDPMAAEEDPIGLDAARGIFPRTDLGRDRMEIDF